MAASRTATVRHASVTLVGQWGRYGIQLAALVVFSRLLSPADVGLVAMVTAVVGIAYVIGDFGLSLAALREDALTPAQRSNLFWWNLAIGILVAAGVAAVAAPLALLYDDERVTAVTLALAVVFAVNGAAVQFRTELALASRYGTVAIADVAGQAVGLVAGIGTVVAGGTYWGLVVMQVVAAVVSSVWVIVGSPWHPSGYDRRAPMRRLLTFGSHTFVTQVINFISTNLDQVLIGRVWGASTLGFYNRAFQVARIPAQQMAAPLTRVVLPHLARALDDPVRFARVVRRAQLSMTSLLVGTLALVAGTADALVPFALGPGWDAAIPLLRLLCVAGAVQAIGYVVYWVLLAHARTGLLLTTEVGARIIMIALMIIAVGWGPTWVAAAVVVGQVLLVTSSVVIALPRVGMSARVLLPAVGPTAVFTLAAAAGAAAGWAASPLPPVLALLVSVTAFAAACGAALVVPAVRRDARELLTLVRSTRRRSS